MVWYRSKIVCKVSFSWPMPLIGTSDRSASQKKLTLVCIKTLKLGGKICLYPVKVIDFIIFYSDFAPKRACKLGLQYCRWGRYWEWPPYGAHSRAFRRSRITCSQRCQIKVSIVKKCFHEIFEGFQNYGKPISRNFEREYMIYKMLLHHVHPN